MRSAAVSGRMRKRIRIISAVAVMMCLMLTSCGRVIKSDLSFLRRGERAAEAGAGAGGAGTATEAGAEAAAGAAEEATGESAPVMQEIPEDFYEEGIKDEPVLIEGSEPERISIEEAGMHEECFSLIEDIIENDIEYGFTSAQLSVMRHGKLVYEGAWGKLDSYEPDGGIKEDSPSVDTETMYDLASVTKMFAVNYGLQKLVSEGKTDLDDRVCDYLGDAFYEDVIDIDYEDGVEADFDTHREWKSKMTIRNLLKHQGGFPADPKYCNPNIDATTQERSDEVKNVLYAGSGADEETREATIDAICRTPLLHEPGTKTLYSDVDYMILGLIMEKVTGKDLDTYLKEEFLKPLGLAHMTFTPLEKGYTADDCAATELNGNTREGYVYYDGIRTYTLQGEVHDEKAYYSMGGISGHAGLFSSATDAARLMDIMLTREGEENSFFTKEVRDEFIAAGAPGDQKWGLGWWRQGNGNRTKYFGSRSSNDTFGHQGWSGILIMADPEKDLVIAFFTNKINTPLTDRDADPNTFNGNWYTTATLGFVPEILYTGLDEDGDVSGELYDLAMTYRDKAEAAVSAGMREDHPARLNLMSKEAVLTGLGQ